MTQEDKKLLFKDLSARLPYKVMVHIKYNTKEPCYGELTPKDIQWFIDSKIKEIKPYLRPMSSMTEDEKKEYISIWTSSIRGDMIAKIDFYIKHHFDFRLTSEGLSMIEAGLALEAPKGMYNIKKK